MTIPDKHTGEDAASQPGRGGGAGPLRVSADGLAATRGFKTIFTDVSFALSDGDLMVVTGPNGAGKSTLLRLVAGLMQPSGGSVHFAPEPEEGAGGLIHYLGHLDGLKPSLNVEDNLRFWQRFWGGGDIGEAMERVGVARLARLPVAVLSAGQKRRTAMARLLVTRRPVWILDEPLTALDSAGEALLGELLTEHLAGGGIALAATHRPLPVAATVTLHIDEAKAEVAA